MPNLGDGKIVFLEDRTNSEFNFVIDIQNRIGGYEKEVVNW